MSSSVVTLPVGPFEHVSMDYARLREEALDHLRRLASDQWTDHNTHDPGITILEQLCYAVTDLGYRTAFPVPELLAGGRPWLPGPEAILTTDPVTSADLRKAALDVEGIGNAWVEEPDAPEVAFYYHAASQQLRLRADPADPDAEPVRLRGLRRVVLQTTDQIQGEAALVAVAKRLHAGRTLGSDILVDLLGTFQVGMTAAVEVGQADDPVELMAEILERIEAYLAPKAHFISRAEALAQGRPIEEVLDGPLLDHGFVDDLPPPRRTIYVSDLLHTILDVPQVKAVRSLVLQGASSNERWALPVRAGTVAVLDPSAQVTLFHRDLPLAVDMKDVRQRLAERRAARALEATRAEGGLGEVEARPRDLTRYRSIQYQLPTAYGVGPFGLPASAPAARRAQARQLAAYLLIFDQLFANALAQLAHARDLLSPDPALDRTYFALPVTDGRLRLDALRVQDAATHQAWLDEHVEVGNPLERRKRFLAHLLARFADELGDHSLIQGAGLPGTEERDRALVADRCEFLLDYPRLSRARGSGYDLGRYGSPDAISGFEERLRHKLGLRNGPRLHVVEHLLLRPVAEDLAQLSEEGQSEVPLLAFAEGPDPWSLRASVVIEERGPTDPAFEQLVQQTILAETPAHLSVRLYWFGKSDGVDDWQAFDGAWTEFRAAYHEYRDLKLRGATLPTDLPLRVRDARDRVIDLLSVVRTGEPLVFGRTYPLRDLPVPDQAFAAPGTPAKIFVDYSQNGVTYQLCDRLSGAPVAGTSPLDGTGGPIELVTPKVDADVIYRIRAVKQEGAQSPDLRRETWLRTLVSVVEGVDPTLVAEIQLPLLNPRLDAPTPADARLGDYGVKAEVKLYSSQEGVTYDLIVDAPDLSDPAKHKVVTEKAVVGTSGDVTLRAQPTYEDVDLRIRGQKATGDPQHPFIRTGVLDAVLLLRVRANPAVPVMLSAPVVSYGGSAVLQVGYTAASAEYTAYLGRVRDRDYVFSQAPGRQTVNVPGDGKTVVLARPPASLVWTDLPGFAPVGAQRGNGATLQWPVNPAGLTGVFALVKASKKHQVGPLGKGSEEVVSAVQLAGAVALLVRPSPGQDLKLGVTLAGGSTTGPIQVDGGEPGVYYELRKDGDTAQVTLPAYFHQRDDENARLNKGVEQIRVEVDLAMARAPLLPGSSVPETPPPPPLLAAPALAEGTVLAVQARRAMSGLLAPLARKALVAPAPSAALEAASVTKGSPAKVVVQASRTDERYWLVQGGTPVAVPVAGNGGALSLSTGPLDATQVVALVASRADATALPVERSVLFKVTVT